MAKRKLVSAVIGSKRHLDLIRAGFRTHHTDGRITHLILDLVCCRCGQAIRVAEYLTEADGPRHMCCPAEAAR